MMSKLVLLLFPKTGFDLEKVNLQMPMSLMALATPLLEDGYSVRILDQRVEKEFFLKLKHYLKDQPICVGISTMTGMQIHYALAIAEFIRTNSSIPIVWGGVHPSLTADQSIRNENVDIIVRGEGEVTFKELVNNLALRRSLDKIKGVTWKDEHGVYHNPDREYHDLSQLPCVSYNLVNIERYILSQIPQKMRSLDVYTSRGCPRSCTFCFNQSFNKSSYRKRDINTVVDEIEWMVKEFNLDSFYINDDNFFVDIDRAHRFSQLLIDRKITREWGCQGVRMDSLEKVDFSLLEKSGCKHLYVGIESGSEKILKYIKKGIEIDQIKAVINRFSESSIIAHYNFMVGYPIETEKELSETIDLVNYIMCTDPKAYFSSFHIITPYPETEFYEQAKEYGFKPPEKLEDWADIRWEFEKAAWIPERMRETIFNLTLLTYFIDRKALDKTTYNPALKLISVILVILAKMRWKFKKFKFCPEFRLVNKLVNKKMLNEIKQTKK